MKSNRIPETGVRLGGKSSCSNNLKPLYFTDKISICFIIEPVPIIFGVNADCISPTMLYSLISCIAIFGLDINALAITLSA